MGRVLTEETGAHRSNRYRRPTRYDASMAAIGRVDGLVLDGADTLALARFWAAMFDTRIASIANEGTANEAHYVDLAATGGTPLLRFPARSGGEGREEPPPYGHRGRGA